jgi:hypothetical protein
MDSNMRETRYALPLCKVSDVIQLILYVTFVSYSVHKIAPLELAASSLLTSPSSSSSPLFELLVLELLFSHLVVLGLQLAQLADAFLGFYTQNPPKPKGE